MHRGSGYIGTVRHHGGWDANNDFSDYSQDDSAQPQSTRYNRTGYGESQIPAAMYTRPSSKDKPSGIPRLGGSGLRPPSAMKVSRNRSCSPASASDSRTVNGSVPPAPQISHAQAPSEISGARDDSYNTGAGYPHNRPHSGLSHCPSSISRPRSRSYSRSGNMDAENPPPLPGSNSDSDGARSVEQTPKRASWAKDRRRFASATPTSATSNFEDNQSDLLAVGDGGIRYDQPPTPVPGIRRSSLKPPSKLGNPSTPTTAPPVPSRIPSVSAKPTREDPKIRQSMERNVGLGNRSHTNPSIGNSRAEDIKMPQIASRRESSQTRTSRASDSSDISSEAVKRPPVGPSSISSKAARPRNHQISKVGSGEVKEQSVPAIISSRHDAQLPTSPFAQSNAASGTQSSRHHGTGDNKRPETISSPVETMLMGSAPTSRTIETPNLRRMSTPIRPTRESSVYVPPTPVTSSTLSGRRLSEPSPSKVTPSAKGRSPTEKEPPPTILQRLTRRASFSSGKSPKTASIPKGPKASSTPKSRLNVDHDTEDSPFDLELETPRPTIIVGKDTGSKNSSSNVRRELSDRQGNRQSNICQSTAHSGPTGEEVRKPRSKIIEEVSGDSEGRLGSPFMGNGSPRFGIDERFRSPKKKAGSGLRYDTFEPDDDRSQELLDYYGHGAVEPANTANYYIEGLPIGTVLSSPESTPLNHTPKQTTLSSPKIQSKKRSQYQYASRTRPIVVGSGSKQKHSGEPAKAKNDNSDGYTPTTMSRSRGPSFVPPPIITRTSVTSLETSTRSEFSDCSDQESDKQGYLSADIHQEGGGSGKGYSGHRTPTSAKFTSQMTQDEPAKGTKNSPSAQTSRDIPKSEASFLRNTPEQHRNRASQLPVLRQRKTNSALFRALEQPYDSSSSVTIESSGSSLGTRESNGVNQGSDYATIGDYIDGLHTVSSIASSLDGNAVGGIRWSGSQELSGAAEALFHNIERSHSRADTKPSIVESHNGSHSSSIGDSAYDMEDETGAVDWSSGGHSPLRNPDGRQHDNHGKRRMSIQDKRKAIHESWRASLEEDQFQRLEETYDPMEIHRQELIWEFHQSERFFVDTLRILVHLFLRPLRTQDQRHWIAGLSPDVTRLFDWLDDITNLHEQLLDALEVMRQDHEQVIILFSEAIQPFIPLMELYQPYIVRMEETSKQIASMALDSRSDFGEFIRIQSALPECELGLEEMIRRPLLRLREYVPFFQTLLTLTPRTHPDHSSCFSLLHSMHAMVCVLDEVKSREEEYELIKNLLSRVNGLSSPFALATRDNRLLAQGPLTRVYIRGGDQPGGKVNPFSRRSNVFVSGRSRTRSGSQSTMASSMTGSTSLYPSTTSSATRLKDSSSEHSMCSDSSATSGANVTHDGLRSNKPAMVTPAQTIGSVTSRFRARTPTADQAEEMEIYALVFTEHIILAKTCVETHLPMSPQRHSNPRRTTFEALGIFRLLGLVDYRGRYGKTIVACDPTSNHEELYRI
ncbi:hypothetical protein B0J17DRAFT_429754 [Rhizoctonia solani]|nr:hypothetical protein B0J17DRAFT_429754 [Rhizoctonia solani]